MKLRRFLWLLVAVTGVALGGLVGLGWPAFPPDAPARTAASRAPGDGGLRRPFPALSSRDPMTPKRVALGRQLYFDPILSGANDMSCATCHHPDLGLSDGRGQSMGKGGTGLGPARTGGAVVKRGAPTLWNAAFNHRQFWDGRASDLEDQARFPITSPIEMDQKPAELVQELRAIPEYVRLFDEAFEGTQGSAVTFENTTRAIAAFEQTLISDASPFDRYRMGDPTALTPAARRGLTLFRSLKTRCFECHGFPTFANPDFKVIGVPDLPGQEKDLGRAETGAGPAYERAFKVPTLRNVALTAPYMHNGRYKTLEEVLAFYAKGGGRGEGLELKNLDDKIRVFSLSTDEQQDLIAFLKSLTDEERLPEIPDRVPSGRPLVPHLRGPAAHATRRAPAESPAKPAPEHAPRTITVRPGASIQAAVDQARPGDTIEVEPGTYRQSVLVDVDRITLRGLVKDGQRAILDGDLEVDNTGLYGVYPVECRDVRVERVVVTGARDAAIYVGQSADIVVRDNEVHDNVTGIEIENSVNALVEGNHAHGNTGGILVFLLPNNPSKVGSDTRVVNNRVIANNHPNFGDPSAIVSQVPPGTGIFIMAADRTEVVGNEVRGNDSLGIGVVSLTGVLPRGTSFDVGVIPEANWIHANTLAGNGGNPAPAVKAMAGRGVDLLWDGSGWDNAWHQPGAIAFPPLLPDRTWPDVLRRAWSRVISYLAEKAG